MILKRIFQIQKTTNFRGRFLFFFFDFGEAPETENTAKSLYGRSKPKVPRFPDKIEGYSRVQRRQFATLAHSIKASIWALPSRGQGWLLF